jgi:AIPR protein
MRNDDPHGIALEQEWRMGIETQIVDQWVTATAREHSQLFVDELGIKGDHGKLRSAAFGFLVVKHLLDLSDAEAIASMVEGGDDFGVDAIHVGTASAGEFPVTLVQGKYRQRLDGKSEFPENSVVSMLAALDSLLDPDKKVDGNSRLMQRIERIHKLLANDLFPRVRIVLCNNGRPWNAKAQNRIDQDLYGRSVTWLHIGPDKLVELLQPESHITETLQLSGLGIVEKIDRRRALIGKIDIGRIAELFEKHGERLLERDIRRHWALSGNQTNEKLAATLRDPDERPNFYFYNNGLTFVCNKFQHTRFQQQNWRVKIEGLQILNGGQTCRTIHAIAREVGFKGTDAQVLLRIYELPKDESIDFVDSITLATNSQNVVTLQDLRSNERKQRLLEESIRLLGCRYRRHRTVSPLEPNEYDIHAVAASVLVVWRDQPMPHISESLLDEFYDDIFVDDLNGAQAIMAVKIREIAVQLRGAEIARQMAGFSRPESQRAYVYREYYEAVLGSADEIAREMGQIILADLGLTLGNVNHTIFEKFEEYILGGGSALFDRGVKRVQHARDRQPAPPQV